MCYDPKDRPPDPPMTRGSARGEDLTLTAEDGTRFSAYLAQPDEPGNAQLLILPDVRGLHPFYQELALRFAEMGIRTLALDYFGRTAGTSARDESFEYRPHVQQIQIPTVLADVRAALAFLRPDGHEHTPTFTLGFCMGGTFSLVSGMQAFDLAGVVAFYPGMNRAFGEGPTVLDRVNRIRYPVLALFGGADPGIPPADVDRLDQELKQTGIPHEIVSYPGAPHSFFDRKAIEFANESADAWKRVLNFIAARAY